MDGFEGNLSVGPREGIGKHGRQCRLSVQCSELLAAATAIAVLLSGLNGLVQIVKAAIELRHLGR